MGERGEHELMFDPYEIMGIESILTPSEISADEKSKKEAIATKELCLKIGSALKEAKEKNGEVRLVLSEAEAWLLRERVNIFMSIGQRHDVGLSIKLKLYDLLSRYAGEKATDDLPVNDGTGDKSKRQVADKIEEFGRTQNQKDVDKGGGDPWDL